MTTNWEKVLGRLWRHSSDVHKILPPCPEERLQAVQAELGTMPRGLVDMLRHFNGAKLFIKAGPMLDVFGVSTVPPLPEFEWAPDWHIDKYTPRWRHASPDRDNQWVIAMTNYGGLIVLDEHEITKQWDTSQAMWETSQWTFDEWVQEILREGDAFMKEE